MTPSNRKRGRPRGTGIDDSERLIAMALKIAETPGLRPTTAIKSLGITNQSTIRRLRDKYRRACQNGSMAAMLERQQSGQPQKHAIINRLNPANDDMQAEHSPTATLHHYAMALQSSVVAVKHRISARTEPPEDHDLKELLDQQYRLSSVILGLIANTQIPTSHHH